MASTALPIVFTELLNLTTPPLAVNADAVKFGSCTLESDKFITCCEPGQVAIIDLSAGNSITRQTMSAEAAIMNPMSKILALKCA
jgi:clathrin heavy chain